MEARLKKLRNFLGEHQLDAVLISKLENLHYFSGFTGDDTLLLVTPTNAELITDFRYIEQAKQQTSDFYIIEQKDGLLAAAAERMKKNAVHKVGFEGGDLCYSDFAAIYKLLPERIEFNTPLKLDELRMIKDAEELSFLRRAVEISDRAFEQVLQFIKPGVRELDVALELETCMRRLGSERPAFTTIIASGVRGSLPHGIATEKLIVDGEFVTMDFGAVYKGYHSDITRTLCVGHADENQHKIYDIVLKAQLLGVEKVQVGASGRAVDEDVRRYIMDAGYGRAFGHGLGHSVGLEIHEEPRLSPLSKCDQLVENMLVTVEPGIYLPGWGGVRIEDTVLVTADGGKPLTQSSKQLIEIE